MVLPTKIHHGSIQHLLSDSIIVLKLQPGWGEKGKKAQNIEYEWIQAQSTHMKQRKGLATSSRPGLKTTVGNKKGKSAAKHEQGPSTKTKNSPTLNIEPHSGHASLRPTLSRYHGGSRGFRFVQS